MSDVWFDKLREDVWNPGLCTQCGSCVGLSQGTLGFQEQHGIPLPIRLDTSLHVPKACFDACPARQCQYPALNQFVFETQPKNWLCGVVRQAYIGHASDPVVRRTGASGGTITALLIHLLETGKIRGAVCVRVGIGKPWRAEPVIARTREEILACAQSVYSVTPVNTILHLLEKEEGPLAYVGLPDQVASIRKLQMQHHASVRAIRYVIGPYMGTQMYFEAIRSFLRSHGVASEEEITELRYRAGEWPGHLRITLRDGRIVQAEKFHYNYLIPFYLTRSSLQLVDFMNELTDISVGDAWSPRYESRGGGYSVILARSQLGEQLLEEMQTQKLLTLEHIALETALDMHGHMLDFKKRGSFIRNGWRKVQPEYGYHPHHISLARLWIEWCLRFLFAIGQVRLARWVIEHLPMRVVGILFNSLRKSWKHVSKPTKRKGLRDMQFDLS